MERCGACVDYKKVREAGREAGQRDFLGFCVGERCCGICQPFLGDVAKEAFAELIRLQSFGGQSCRSFTGCVVSR